MTKLLIIGHARSGKDTLAEFWHEEFGMSYKSSSLAAAEIFIYDELKDKYGYSTPQECFEDRVNHRVEWYDMIHDYNKDDPTRLAKEIMKDCDCYVGMRNVTEAVACRRQGVFDLTIRVDAEERVGKEGQGSMNISKQFSDIIIDNNRNENIFINKARNLGKVLLK